MDIPNINFSEYKKERKCYNFAFAEMNHDHPLQSHRHDFYQILLLEQGSATHTIDFETYHMQAPAAAVIFPSQIHKLEFSDDAKGRYIFFDETIFCSAVLANDLKEYNIDLHKKINNLAFKGAEDVFNEILEIDSSMRNLYTDMTPIKKMQIKFMVKIILLKLIDFSPVDNLTTASDKDLQYYIRFRELLDENVKTERKLSFYTNKLGISQKKLTAVCQQYSGTSPLILVHEKLTLEIKKQFALKDVTLKEIAYEFGFSSQAALNKFINTKFQMTPSELKDLVTGKIDIKD